MSRTWLLRLLAWARPWRVTRLRREIECGALLPRGYGVAWYMVDRDMTVCYPVPLNAALALARRAWLWLRVPPLRDLPPYDLGVMHGRRIERQLHDAVRAEAYDRGYLRGWTEAANTTLRLVQERAAVR